MTKSIYISEDGRLFIEEAGETTELVNWYLAEYDIEYDKGSVIVEKINLMGKEIR